MKESTHQIRQAIREGNTEAAVNLLLQTDEKEAMPMFDKFSEAKQQYTSHLIGIEEWARTQTQIYQNILEMDFMQATEILQNPTSEIRAKAIQLLHERKTEQAITLCEGFGDQYLFLKAQLNAAKSQCGTGLLEFEYFEATKSKLNDSLQTLMMEIEEPPRSEGLFVKILRRFT